MSLAQWSVTQSAQGKRIVFFSKLSQCFVENTVIAGSDGEESHGRHKLHVVGVSKNLVKTQTNCLENRVGALGQPPPKNGVAEVSLSLIERRNGVLLRHEARPEALNLRKNEPHPMGSFVSAPKLRKNAIIDRVLCLDESAKVEWIIHRFDRYFVTGTTVADAGWGKTKAFSGNASLRIAFWKFISTV
jgi:hypothetical protein